MTKRGTKPSNRSKKQNDHLVGRVVVALLLIACCTVFAAAWDKLVEPAFQVSTEDTWKLLGRYDPNSPTFGLDPTAAPEEKGEVPSAEVSSEKPPPIFEKVYSYETRVSWEEARSIWQDEESLASLVKSGTLSTARDRLAIEHVCDIYEGEYYPADLIGAITGVEEAKDIRLLLFILGIAFVLLVIGVIYFVRWDMRRHRNRRS